MRAEKAQLEKGGNAMLHCCIAILLKTFKPGKAGKVKLLSIYINL